MRLFAALLCLACWASPAAAALADAEIVEIKRYATAGSALDAGMVYVGAGASDLTATNRPHVAEAMRTLSVAHKALHDSLALLLGANIDQSGYWVGRARAEFVTSAWWHLDRALVHLEGARVAVVAAQAATLDSARRDDFMRAATIWIPGALKPLKGVNRSLPYADPRPVDYPEIIGPHGSYESAQARIIHALRFVAEALDEGRAAVLTGEPAWPTYQPLARLWLRASAVTGKQRTAMLRWASIPVDAADCQRNRFHLVAHSVLPLLSHTSSSQGIDGAPYHYNQFLGDAQAGLLEIAATRPLARQHIHRLLQRWSDSWRWMDGATGAVLVFPHPDRLAEIRDQSRPSAAPFAPPVCP